MHSSAVSETCGRGVLTAPKRICQCLQLHCLSFGWCVVLVCDALSPESFWPDANLLHESLTNAKTALDPTAMSTQHVTRVGADEA